jgi:uncharacterized protein (DUF305 family)
MTSSRSRWRAKRLRGEANEKEGSMNRRLLLIATLIVLAAAMQAEKYAAQSAMFIGPPITAPTPQFTASTDTTFDQLMGDAMNVMGKGMHNTPHTGDPDHDFATMMIPHHQGAIDMAKAVLRYGKVPQMRRRAQQIITAQQSEIQLMQLWLTQHDANSGNPIQRPSSDAEVSRRQD